MTFRKAAIAFATTLPLLIGTMVGMSALAGSDVAVADDSGYGITTRL